MVCIPGSWRWWWWWWWWWWWQRRWKWWWGIVKSSTAVGHVVHTRKLVAQLSNSWEIVSSTTFYTQSCGISFNLINDEDALECEIGSAWFDSNLSGSGRWRNELRLKQFEKYFTLCWTNCRWRRRRKDKNRKITQRLVIVLITSQFKQNSLG